MSYNGAGTFVINSAGQPVVAGTTITSTAFNALTADFATGFSTAICKDGQTTITANIPMGGFKLTGLALATNTGDALSYGRNATVAALTATDLVDISGASAGQIKFPATQNASSNANTLDDYEEGTWVPTFSASTTPPTGVTYAGQTGWYVKIGSTVFAAFELSLTNAGSGGVGNALLTGLPFTVGATAGSARSFTPCYFNSQTLTVGTGIAIQPVTTTTTALLAQFGSAAAAANLTWASTSNTLEIRGTIMFNI